eukprot:gene30379-40365_t
MSKVASEATGAFETDLKTNPRLVYQNPQSYPPKTTRPWQKLTVISMSYWPHLGNPQLN